MKTCKALKQSMKAVFSSYGMWMAVIASAFLFLTATLVTDGEGRRYSALQVLFLIRGEWGTQFQSFEVLNLSAIRTVGQSAYLAMFLPVVAAFPGIPFLLDELKSGMSRYSIHRSGRYQHYLGHVLAVWLCGGLAVMFGYILAAVPVLAVFPHPGEMQQMLEPVLFDMVVFGNNSLAWLYSILGDVGLLLSFGLDMFFYGAFFSLPAILFVGFLRNKYLVLCFPMILLFFYDTVWKKIYNYYRMAWDQEMLMKIDSWASNSLSSAATMPTVGKWLWILAGLLVTAVLYCILMGRRLDCGA